LSAEERFLFDHGAVISTRKPVRSIGFLLHGVIREVEIVAELWGIPDAAAGKSLQGRPREGSASGGGIELNLSLSTC
jgi:hypothetical protein